MAQATCNFRYPDDNEVREMTHTAQLVRRMRLVKQMLAGQAVNLTQDRELYLAFNRERMTMEDFVKHSAQYCTEATAATKARRAADERDHNPKSKAKWRQLGNIPMRVYLSRPELWGNPQAIKKFLNQFPQFRVSTSRV